MSRPLLGLFVMAALFGSISASKRAPSPLWRLGGPFPFMVSGSANKPFLVYVPLAEVREKFAQQNPVLMVEYVAPGERYRRDIILPLKVTDGWSFALTPRENDVLIAFKVEVGDEFDDNSGLGYWMLRVGLNGRPVKDALRQEGRILEAFDRREGTTDYEAALAKYNEELALYPDNYAAVHDRFRVLAQADEANLSKYQDQAIQWATEMSKKPRNADGLLTAIRIYLDDDLKLDMRAEAHDAGRRFLQLFPRHPGSDVARFALASVQQYATPQEEEKAFQAVAATARDEVIRARATLARCNALQNAGDIVALTECAYAYITTAPPNRFYGDGIIYASKWASSLAEAGYEPGARSVIDASLSRILSREFDLGYMWRFPVSRRVKRNYEHGRLLLAQAKLERRLGRLDKALATLADAQRQFQEDPDLADVFREISEIYESKADFKNALTSAKNAYERDPYDGELERRLRAMWVKVNGSDRGLAEYQKTARKQAQGERAPDFRAYLRDGKTITLSDLEGKIVLLNFWATWCGPCIREMPALNALVEAYRKRIPSEIYFLAITNESEKRVNWFLNKQPFAYEIAVNGARMTEAFQAFAYPTHVVIDATGRIRYRQIGATEKIEEKLRAIVERLLDENRERRAK